MSNDIRAPGGFEDAKLLITVKTYPTPSQRNVETVCVGGVRLDTPTPEWVRLYPIPFRLLGEAEQFKKYQIVHLQMQRRGSADPRPESYRPRLETLDLREVIDSSKNWSKRANLIRPLIGATTTCVLIEVNRAVPMNQPAPSLGLVRAKVERIVPIKFRDWNQRQLEKARAAAQGDLFSAPLQRLKPVPYRLRVIYKCESIGCHGHKQEILDWELGAAGILWQRQYKGQTASKILEKWEGMLLDDRKESYLYVGNQHQYRKSFSILGVWYPKRDAV